MKCGENMKKSIFPFTLTQKRKEYLKQFKEGFRQQLDGVKVVDAKGNDVTPKRKGDA